MLTTSRHVMTLANSIIGVGILAMPFCFLKCGILLSVCLLVVSNWVTRLCCHYLIKSSLLTRRKSIEFLGFHAFGPSGKLLVELCIIGYLLGTCITYFVVVGDLGPQIITRMFSLDSGHTHLRTVIMIAVTLICILPLGMLKNVDSLSTVCTASIGFYICFVIKIILESQEHIILNDWTDKVVYWQPAGILQCLPIFSMALSCQMQIFEVFSSVHNQSLEKLNDIVRNSTWMCTFVYVGVGFFGYVAFCTQTFSGNILLNLSPSFSSDVIKIGFILSVAFSFPLVIFPCRASLYSLLYRKGHTDAASYIPESRFKAITIFIVGFSLCVALMIPSVELIIGLVGSTIGVAICIMFPASCFRKIVRKESTERTSAQFVLIAGFCLMILGTYANLSAIYEKRSGMHILHVQDSNVEKLFAAEKMDFLVEQLKQSKVKPKNEIMKEIELKVQKPSNISLSLIDNKNIAVQTVSDLPQKENLKPEGNNSKNMEATKEKEDNEKYIGTSPAKKGVNSVLKPELSNSNADVPPLVQNTINEKKSPQKNPITIANEAIKNSDAVAAEEFKDTQIKTQDELKKTQNELKKTKELLERTVDELKEELAKQTKETQNLVVEKLGEVVEKVEQIERKVQNSEIEHKPPAVLPTKIKDSVEPVTSTERTMLKTFAAHDIPVKVNVDSRSSLLLTRLAENPDNSLSLEIKTTPKPDEVYEPLSYKTGELLENTINISKIDQRFPLPLALLINAAQSKANDSETANINTIGQIVIVKGMHHDKTLEKENIESIRRDILQLNLKQSQEIPPMQPTVNNINVDAEVEVTSQRAKRAIKLHELENYLAEPKVEMLMKHSISNALDLKKQNLGRDLKSILETENT